MNKKKEKCIEQAREGERGSQRERERESFQEFQSSLTLATELLLKKSAECRAQAALLMRHRGPRRYLPFSARLPEPLWLISREIKAAKR